MWNIIKLFKSNSSIKQEILDVMRPIQPNPKFQDDIPIEKDIGDFMPTESIESENVLPIIKSEYNLLQEENITLHETLAQTQNELSNLQSELISGIEQKLSAIAPSAVEMLSLLFTTANSLKTLVEEKLPEILSSVEKKHLLDFTANILNDTKGIIPTNTTIKTNIPVSPKIDA